VFHELSRSKKFVCMLSEEIVSPKCHTAFIILNHQKFLIHSAFAKIYNMKLKGIRFVARTALNATICTEMLAGL